MLQYQNDGGDAMFFYMLDNKLLILNCVRYDIYIYIYVKMKRNIEPKHQIKPLTHLIFLSLTSEVPQVR